MIAKTNTQYYQDIADSIRYSKDNIQYESDLTQEKNKINQMNKDIANAYDEAEAKGATMPATENSANLAQTVASIPEAVQPTLISKQITENGTYAAEDETPPAYGYSEVEVDVDINQKLDAYIQGDLTNIVTNATKIAPSIFRNTSITRVSMLNATEIGRQAFFSCADLVSVNLSNNLIAIKESAFQSDNNLELSELPDSLNTIESSAFNSCNKIAITKLPKNIKKIFASSFSNCTSIPYLDVSEVLQIPVLSSSSAFLNTTFPFYFADQTQLNSWAAASNWSALASRFQIKGATT